VGAAVHHAVLVEVAVRTAHAAGGGRVQGSGFRVQQGDRRRSTIADVPFGSKAAVWLAHGASMPIISERMRILRMLTSSAQHPEP
jgi:hypothetical protein